MDKTVAKLYYFFQTAKFFWKKVIGLYTYCVWPMYTPNHEQYTCRDNAIIRARINNNENYVMS